jgi:hypothetical protein
MHHRNKKTALSIGQGLWRFTIMLFILCNGPAMFEVLMESTLWNLIYKASMV